MSKRATYSPCEDPFGNSQGCGVILANAGNALQDNGEHAEKNQNEKNEVEEAACKGVMAKDDYVPFFTPGCGAVHWTNLDGPWLWSVPGGLLAKGQGVKLEAEHGVDASPVRDFARRFLERR